MSSQETTRKRAEHEDLLLKREQLCAEVTWRTASVNKMKDQADQLHRSNQEQGGVLWHALVLPLEFAKNSIIFFYMYHSFVGFSNTHNMLFSKDMIFVFYTFEVYTVLWKKCKLNLCYPIILIFTKLTWYVLELLFVYFLFCIFSYKNFLFSLPETAMKTNKEKLEEKQREQAEKKKDYDQTRYSSLPQEVSLFVSLKVKRNLIENW